jgi:biopolymer transport protein ExbB
VQPNSVPPVRAPSATNSPDPIAKPASEPAIGEAKHVPQTNSLPLATLPRDLSPWGMFRNAVLTVKIVMVGLAIAPWPPGRSRSRKRLNFGRPSAWLREASRYLPAQQACASPKRNLRKCRLQWPDLPRLFGTVWGIIDSFIGISRTNTTNLAVVAPGIAEVLLATAMGLVAAIPAFLMHSPAP